MLVGWHAEASASTGGPCRPIIKGEGAWRALRADHVQLSRRQEVCIIHVPHACPVVKQDGHTCAEFFFWVAVSGVPCVCYCIRFPMGAVSWASPCATFAGEVVWYFCRYGVHVTGGESHALTGDPYVCSCASGLRVLTTWRAASLWLLLHVGFLGVITYSMGLSDVAS
jgi:hypothetical protein